MSTIPTGANNPFEWEADDGEVESPDHIEEGQAYIDALAAGFDHHTIKNEADWAGVSAVDDSTAESSEEFMQGEEIPVDVPWMESTLRMDRRHVAAAGVGVLALLVLAVAGGA